MGWLDAVKGAVSGGYSLATDSHYREQMWNSAVNEAKSAANFAATAVRSADAAKEQFGSWIDSGEKYLEKKVDDGRAWLRENGGVLGRAASDQIGFSEGVGLSVYDAGKGLVQLADGAGSLANPIEWAANPSANIARVESAVNSVEVLGKIAGLASPASWVADPKGNAQLAGALWNSAATSFENDPAKFTGNVVGTFGTLFIPGADAAAAAGDAGRVTALLGDAGKLADVTETAGRIGALTLDAGKAVDAGRAVDAAANATHVLQLNEAAALKAPAFSGQAVAGPTGGFYSVARSEGLPAASVARGEPYAFGIGARSDRAAALIDRSAQALGRNNASSLIDNVVYDSAARSPFFRVDRMTGQRTITMDPATFGKTESGQLIAGTHELVHAEQWEQLLSQHSGNLATAHSAMFVPQRSLSYATREVLTERRALQRVDGLLGGLTPQQTGHSTRYIEFWQNRVVRLSGSRVP